MKVASGFDGAAGIAVDSVENLFVADSANNRVVELPLIGGAYGSPLIVGSGLNNPMGVAVDASRNLFIADTGNKRMVKEIYTVSGYLAPQYFWTNTISPISIAVDKNDDLFIADSQKQQMFEMTWFAAADRFQSQLVVGSGLVSPSAATVDASGNVYIADPGGYQVVEVVSTGLNFYPVNVGSSSSLMTYNFNISAGTTLGGVVISRQGVSGEDFVDAGGSTCVAQTYTVSTYCGVNVKFMPLASGARAGAVTLLDANGNPVVTTFFAGVGNGPQAATLPGTVTALGAQLSGPTGVAVDGRGNLYIADTGNNRIEELPWTGNGYGPQTTLPVSGLINPMGMTIDAAGSLYIVSNGNDKVVKLPWTQNGFGSPIKVGAGLSGPSAVAVDTKGNVYITDTLDTRVDEYTWTGTGYSTEQQVGNYHKDPIGLAVDGNGNVYFTDPYQNSISEIGWAGTHYLTQVDMNTVQTSFPSALAVDGNSNLYILDTNNNRVIMLPWSGAAFGKQITVASGFNAPGGIAIANGQLFVADTGNNQVVKIDLSTPAAMSFANAYLGATSADGMHVAQIENLGNQPLAFNSMTYPVDFPEAAGVSNPCTESSSLSQGQSCELGVNFTPQTTGSPLTEAIQITGDSLGIAAPQLSIPVTGTSLGKVTQTINFSQITSLIYGVAPVPLSAVASSGLPVTFTVTSGPGVMQKGSQLLRVTGAGTVVITAAQAGNSTYWAANSIELAINVAPATLVVTPTARMGVYGSIPTSFSYSMTGFVDGDNALTATTGSPAIASSASSTSPAGSYVLTASRGTLASANYTFAFSPGTLAVVPARIMIVASSVIHTYGSPIKAFPWIMVGFVNGDTSSVVTGAPTLTSVANSGSPVGTYPILVSPGTLAASNYTFFGSNGQLTVTPAMLNVTATNQAMTYGRATPSLTYWLSGLVNGDPMGVVQGNPVISTTAGLRSGAGTYAISVSSGTLTAANYTFRFFPGVLTIGKAVLRVTPVNTSMTYGGKLPSFSYTLAGFANGDAAVTSVIGAPSLSTLANSATKPGNYVISSTVGTLTSGNYSFSFGAGTLTVGKAQLMITPRAAVATYGAALPALTYAVTGFVNGDGNSSMQGAPALVTTATPASHVGSYPIVCATGTLTSQQYTFSCSSGTLTINKAIITVKGASLSMTYGGPLPALSTQLSGFVNGDSAAVVSGIASVSSVVTPVTPVGVYPFTVGVGSLAAADYSFIAANGAITVKKATLIVTAATQTTTYGAALPALTYTMTGFVNGDSQRTATSGVPQMSTTAAITSPTGNYLITSAPGSLAAQNYTFGFAPAWMKVNKATLTVTANNLSMQVGGTVPVLTYSMSGWVNGDTESTAITGAPSLTTSATSKSAAGSYTITVGAGSIKANNYQVAGVNGTLIATQLTASLHRILIRQGFDPPIRRQVPWLRANPSKDRAARRAQ